VENIGLYQYLLTSFVLSIIQYVLATTTTGESTSRVQNNEKGTLLGLEHSLFAAARIATPQLGTMILTNYGVSAVSISCGAVYGSIALLWIAFDSHRSKIPVAKVPSERKER
jgi:predicted MFS family arabinose efflux permease